MPGVPCSGADLLLFGDIKQDLYPFEMLDAAAGGIPGRQNKAALLQEFLPQHQTAAMPVKHLDHATVIDEDEKGARKGVCPQLRTDDTAQTVKGLAHIAGTPV